MERGDAAALAAHDPSRLPLAKNVRYTENGAELTLGNEGLWATFNKAEPYRHDVVDPDTGGIASYFTIVENKLIPFHDLLAVRLKVRNRQITEIETIAWVDPFALPTLSLAVLSKDHILPLARRMFS